MDGSQQAILGFFTLLLLPFLGVMSLLKRRAVPWLAWFALCWGAGGWLYLRSLTQDTPEREPLERAWRVGAALAGAFLVTAWVVGRPRVARGLKLLFAVLAVLTFLRALYLYVNAYA